MKRLPYALVFSIVLAIVGAVAVGFMQGRSQPLASAGIVAPGAVPTAVAALPDIALVPFYPDASNISARASFNGRPVAISSISPADLSRYAASGFGIAYDVGASREEAYEFYRATLPKAGWVLQSTDGPTSQYSWADPARRLPWNVYLELDIELTPEGDRTMISLTLHRFPAIENGLPTYPDARQISTVQRDEEETSPFGQRPVHVTEVTYITGASSEEIADFYNQNMPEDGWEFFDRAGSGQVHAQTGDINSEEGLFLRGTRRGWGDRPITSYRLFITAKKLTGKDTFVRLRAEEFELYSGN